MQNQHTTPLDQTHDIQNLEVLQNDQNSQIQNDNQNSQNSQNGQIQNCQIQNGQIQNGQIQNQNLIQNVGQMSHIPQVLDYTQPMIDSIQQANGQIPQMNNLSVSSESTQIQNSSVYQIPQIPQNNQNNQVSVQNNQISTHNPNQSLTEIPNIDQLIQQKPWGYRPEQINCILDVLQCVQKFWWGSEIWSFLRFLE